MKKNKNLVHSFLGINRNDVYLGGSTFPLPSYVICTFLCFTRFHGSLVIPSFSYSRFRFFDTSKIGSGNFWLRGLMLIQKKRTPLTKGKGKRIRIYHI